MGIVRLFLVALLVIASVTASARVADAETVEQRIAEFWKRVEALRPSDHLAAADLGQWALNLIERDVTARISVADFRNSTAYMQAAIERAGPAPVPAVAPSAAVEQRIAVFWQRVDALQPADRLAAADLGQWALNVIDRDVRARIVVTDFRASASGMQAGIERVTPRLGYSGFDVLTPRGTFHVQVIKERLADITVRTVTANTTDCFDACPAKPLADYVYENAAFAGMHGSYLCPPDYAGCAGKVNSYEYAVYNSALRKWLNPRAFDNPVNAIVTVEDGALTFYRRVKSFDRGPVTAGISNYPLLLTGGALVNSEAEQSEAQKQRGAKGSIGSDGTHLFLVLVWNASVTDSAYVLQALGVRDAMNLDGGGTSAMHYGGTYRVGPGRLLPNAILLLRR